MIFLFFGDDVYSHREKIAFWRSEFEKRHGGDMNIEILAGKGLKPAGRIRTGPPRGASIARTAGAGLGSLPYVAAEGDRPYRTAAAAPPPGLTPTG